MKSKDYQEFTEKFKPKLTTDDCITPDAVYDAVLGWVCKEYGVTPEQVVTAAILQRWAAHGVEFKVRRCDCMPISRLDGQREKGDAIFGGGLLLSERAAAERAAAERAAAERWMLSDREKALVAELGTKGGGSQM